MLNLNECLSQLLKSCEPETTLSWTVCNREHQAIKRASRTPVSTKKRFAFKFDLSKVHRAFG